MRFKFFPKKWAEYHSEWTLFCLDSVNNQLRWSSHSDTQTHSCIKRGKIIFFNLLCEIPVVLSTTVLAGYSCRRAVRVFSAYVWLWLWSMWVLVSGQGVVDSTHLRGITSGHSGLSHALYCRWDQASVSFPAPSLHFLTSFPFFYLPVTLPHHSSLLTSAQAGI